MRKYIFGITLLLLAGTSAPAQETNAITNGFGDLTVSDAEMLLYKGALFKPTIISSTFFVRQFGSVLICGTQSANDRKSVPGAVATGSQLTHDRESRSRDPVATAPGTDLILKLRHY